MGDTNRGDTLRRAIETCIKPDDAALSAVADLFTADATVWSPNMMTTSLAGLVETRSIGGRSGNGGPGGKGGKGGKGGPAQTVPGQSCNPGNAGNDGVAGNKGADGRDGPFGPRAQILTVSRRDIFGPQVPPQLRELIDYQPPRR